MSRLSSNSLVHFLVVPLVACLALYGVVTFAAAASTPSAPVTYYACLKSGSLSKVGTAKPVCHDGSQVISWNAAGPQGSPGTPGVMGLTGATGSAGAAGATGSAGAAGDRGSLWNTGTGAPGTITGQQNGDLYLNVTSGAVYELTGGAWTLDGNITGPAGATGLTGATGSAGAAGATGSAGAAGAAGSPGGTGAAGARGSLWNTGTGAPGTISGEQAGDLYLDAASGSVYELVTGLWTFEGNITGPTGATGSIGLTGSTGAAGTRGSLWSAGTGAPGTISGEQAGDLYLDTSSGEVYDLLSGSWSPVGNITGPAGIRGVPGDTGSQGIQGIQGIQGNTGPAGPSSSVVTGTVTSGQPCTTGDIGINTVEGNAAFFEEVFNCVNSTWLDTGTSIDPNTGAITTGYLYSGEVGCYAGSTGINTAVGIGDPPFDEVFLCTTFGHWLDTGVSVDAVAQEVLVSAATTDVTYGVDAPLNLYVTLARAYCPSTAPYVVSGGVETGGVKGWVGESGPNVTPSGTNGWVGEIMYGGAYAYGTVYVICAP